MKNLSRNTAAVLVLTLFTGLAVFSAIQLGYGNGQGSGTSDPYGYGGSTGSSSSGGGQTYTCPATGCTASSCHATQ
jgi:hypothetical protein